MDQGQRFISGYTDDKDAAIDRSDLPLIVFGDHTRVFKYVDFVFAPGADGTQLLKPGPDFDPYFFYLACLDLELPSRGYNRHFTILKEKSLPKPPREEQRKIAAVLLKLQRAISSEDAAIEATKELKRAALPRLFGRGLRRETTRETEIGMIPLSWDVQPLEELREFLQYGTSAKCDYGTRGNAVLRIPNIVDGRVDASDLKWCTLSAKEVASLRLEYGDVLFIRTNGVRERVGTCAVYEDSPSDSLFASYLIRARLKREVLDPFFLQYYTSTQVGSSFLSGRSSPAADGKFNVNTKTIDSVLLPLPAIEEQKEIVAMMRVVDASLDCRKRKVTLLRELFAALLHRLVSGEVRVEKLVIDTSEAAA